LWIELSVDSLSFFDKGVKKMQDRNIHKNWKIFSPTNAHRHNVNSLFY
jgi:hypothetical protein